MTNRGSMLILVVEDDLDIGELLCEVLNDEGFQVLWARSAEQALQQLESVHPALITLDLNLSGMQGADLLRLLHADPVRWHIPVMVVSANLVQTEDVRLLARDVLPKPFQLDTLLARVAAIVAKPPLLEPTATEPDAPSGPTS